MRKTLALFFAIMCAVCCSAKELPIDGSITQDSDGEYSFVLGLRDNQFESAVPDVEIRSPNGDRHSGFWNFGPSRDLIVFQTGMSLDVLNDQYAGSWTFEETLSSGEVFTTEFSMPAIGDGDFPPAPTFLRPIPGDEVSEEFEISFTPEYPLQFLADNPPSVGVGVGVGVGSGSGDRSVSTRYSNPRPGRINMELREPLPQRGPLTITLESRGRGSEMSQVTPDGEGIWTRYRVEQFIYRARSEVNVQLVPEPCLGNLVFVLALLSIRCAREPASAN